MGASPSGPKFTAAELAVHLGITESAVLKAEKRGAIHRDADGLFDPARAPQDWRDNRRGTAGPGRPPGQKPAGRAAGGETLIEVQTAHEKVKLAERRVKLARMKDSLVDKRAVDKEVFELIRASREAWMNFPAEVAPDVAAELGADAAAVEIVLERVVRTKLSNMTAATLRADSHAA